MELSEKERGKDNILKSKRNTKLDIDKYNLNFIINFLRVL